MGILLTQSRVAGRLAVLGVALLAGGLPRVVVGQVPVDAASPSAPITAEQKAAILKRVGSNLEHLAAPSVDATKWPGLVEKYKSRLDAAGTAERFANVLDQAFGEFGVSGLVVLAPKMAELEVPTWQVGIGIKHSGRSEPFADGLVIDRVIAGGPAEKAGIKDGDTILKSDGVALTGTEPLRGDEGSVVVLTIRRAAAEKGKVEDVTVTRGKFGTRDPVSFAKLDEETAFIRIPSFGRTYNRKRVETLFKDAKGSKYLIIDLRDNSGGEPQRIFAGLAFRVDHFLGLLLEQRSEYGVSIDADTVYEYKKKAGKDAVDLVDVFKSLTAKRDSTEELLEILRETDKRLKVERNPIEPFAGKVAVLVNRATAFEAEIAAAALRELCVPPAVLAGGRTAGTVMMRKDEPVPGGFRMSLPVAEYFTIKGQRLEGNPLKPDIGGPESLERVGNKPETDELVGMVVKELKKGG